jgi:hypothetical protein
VLNFDISKISLEARVLNFELFFWGHRCIALHLLPTSFFPIVLFTNAELNCAASMSTGPACALCVCDSVCH